MNQDTESSIQNNKVVVTFLNLLLADEYVLYIHNISNQLAERHN